MSGKGSNMEFGKETTRLLALAITSSPTERKEGWLQKPESSILMATGMESFARYCVLSNLVFFLHYWMELNSKDASIVALVVTGCGYLLAVAAGVLADTRLGRYKTYRLSIVLQLFGALLLLGSSLTEDVLHRRPEMWVKVLALTGLALVSLGMAGSYSSAIPLGVDQYRMDGGGVSAAAGFFPRYYWGINVGAFFSFTVVSFLQLNSGFQYGYMFSCGGYCAALLCLYVGKARLQLMPPLGSPLRTVWDVYAEAFSRWRKLRSGGLCEEMPIAEGNSHGNNTRQKTSFSVRSREHMVKKSFLERAKISEGGRSADWKVDEVRMLGRLTVLLLTLTVYLTAYSQLSTAFVLQGERMRLPLHSENIYFPASMLASFDALAILVAIPLLYGVVFPFIKRTACCLHFSLLRRMGFGMILALISVMAAFFVEIYRSKEGLHAVPYHSHYNKQNFTASPMLVYYQIPQYVFFGLSEVFTIVAGLEFAYARAPNTMHGVCMGVFFGVYGIGTLLSSVLVKIATDIDTHMYYTDLEKPFGNVQYFYAVLAGLLFTALIIYTAVSRWFKGIIRRGYFEAG